MTKGIADGSLLWQPTTEWMEEQNLTKYQRWVEERLGLTFEDHQELWRWSVDQQEDFWGSVWEYCGVKASKPYQQVLARSEMPGAKWFTGAELNYAEHVFLNRPDDKAALYFRSERSAKQEVSWKELREKTAAVAHALKEMGVRPGDRVVAYLPNIPEAVVAFLACASIGAIWSICSPDFGTASVVDRFQQIEPTVLIAVDGCQFNGKVHDKRSVIEELKKQLPTLKKTVVIPFIEEALQASGDVRLAEGQGLTASDDVLWADAVAGTHELTFEQVDFDHPLWILYSSGTTGLPKPIVHGHGGILIEHLKTLLIEQTTTEDDVFFWYTTTGWMMWNLLMSGLLAGSAIVLYDGSPSYPSMAVLWDVIEDLGVTFFGTSAGYLNACAKFGVKPNQIADLSRLKSIGSTAAPLTAEGFAWVYEHVNRNVWLGSLSGGTDVCAAFVGGSPTLAVRAGLLQSRALGARVEAFDEEGRSVVGEVGELVVTAPMPSMPLYFWNDEGNVRYQESYFDMYPGVWRHGDWIQIHEDGSCVIFGRSDSTINRAGVRMGTSDLYRIAEARDEILESLVIDLEYIGRESFLPMFVVMQPGHALDDELKEAIKHDIRTKLSPRFVPDEVYEVKQIPKTLNGKKLEVPVRKILLGMPLEKSVNPDSMANPESLAFFVELAERLNRD